MGRGPVARPEDFQAGARRRVHFEVFRGALRRGARQPGQFARLCRAHVIQRQAGGHRLRIGKDAERVQAGGAKAFRHASARDQRRGRHRFRRAAGIEFPEIDPGGRQNLRRIQPAEQSSQRGQRQGCGFEQPRRDIQPRRPQPVPILRQGQQEVRPAGFQQGVLGQGAGRDQPHHVAPDRHLGIAPGLGVFHLLGHGHAKAAPDQPRQIIFRRMHRHAAHGNRRPAMRPARGQRDIQRRRGSFGVGEEQLIEIAHAEEDQRIRVLRLGGKPLRHRRGRAGGVAVGQRGVHGLRYLLPRPDARQSKLVGRAASC